MVDEATSWTPANALLFRVIAQSNPAQVFVGTGAELLMRRVDLPIGLFRVPTRLVVDVSWSNGAGAAAKPCRLYLGPTQATIPVVQAFYDVNLTPNNTLRVLTALQAGERPAGTFHQFACNDITNPSGVGFGAAGCWDYTYNPETALSVYIAAQPAAGEIVNLTSISMVAYVGQPTAV